MMTMPRQAGTTSTRLRWRLILGAEGLIVLLSSVAVLVGVGSGAYADFDPLSAAVLFGGVWLYWFLGVLIVVRVDGHRVGWLFTLGATLLAATFACWSLAALLGEAGSPMLDAGWFYVSGALLFTPAVIVTLPAVAMVFPTGALPSPRWRRSVAVVVGLVVIETVAVLIGTTLLNDQVEGQPPSAPMAVVAPIVEAAMALGALAIPLAAVVGVAAISVRFRRARGIQRRQLKWFVAAIVPAAILLPLGTTELATAYPIISFASALTFPLAALAIGISILRYRLYDIDRIVSRSIGWALVTGVLLAVFAAGVIGLQALLDGFTQGETLAVAASTLVAFALFQPVRRRVQSGVDRRFDRARYDGTQTADAFASRLRDEVDLESVAADLRATVQASVRPVTLGLWLRREVP